MKTIVGIFLIVAGLTLLFFMYNIDFGAYASIETVFQKGILVLLGIAFLIMGSIFISNDKLNEKK